MPRRVLDSPPPIHVIDGIEEPGAEWRPRRQAANHNVPKSGMGHFAN